MDEFTKISNIDPTLNICLWSVTPEPNDHPLLAHLSFLKSELSQLVLEVPEYASHEGVNIIQYLHTGGGNQRWKI